MQQQPYYVIPILIEQPTWGGQYIAEFKELKDQYFAEHNIGQSYELSSANKLHTDPAQARVYALGSADAPDQAQPVTEVEHVSMPKLIASDPERILGAKTLAKFGTNFPLLIKFTQAQENSYQLHVKPGSEFNGWQAKPESWYYLEQGSATLGIKDLKQVEAYKKRCLEIDAKAQELSAKVTAGELAVADARQELQIFIDADHPSNYVNTVQIKPGQIIDLSSGGVHHSWEADPAAPLGNIVYEVQVDVRDNTSTLRSFDQGKIKDDGSIRPLTIDDYFTALDTTAEMNKPDTHMRTSAEIQDDGCSITTLFDNKYYVTKKLTVTGSYVGTATQLNDTFHHLFALDAPVSVGWRDQEYHLPKGCSLFIPACCDTYELRTADTASVLLSHPAC